jgi:hypothetical protein
MVLIIDHLASSWVWGDLSAEDEEPLILFAWENRPTCGASSGEEIAVLLIAAPVATSVADQFAQTHESHVVSLGNQHSSSSLFAR